MTLLRVKHEKNYTVVNNFICKDKRLSFKAKGIWLYAFSRPDDWTFHIQDLINQGTDKVDAVRSGLKELEKCGYLLMERERKPDGTLGSGIWTFYELPQPKVENPILDNPILENPLLLSTDTKLSTDREQNSLKVLDPPKAPDGGDIILPSKKKIKKEYSPEATQLAQELIAIQKVKKPDIKPPAMDPFVFQVDQMIRTDGRSPEKILEVFRWVLYCPWRGAKMVGSKAMEMLRKNFDEYETAMITVLPNNNKIDRRRKNDDGTLQQMENWF